MKRWIYRMMVCLVTLLSAQSLHAQNETSIQGIIKDSATGEPLPFVSVRLVKDGQFKTGVFTGIDGSYAIHNLTPGTYTLQVQNMNYTRVEKKIIINAVDYLGDVALKPENIEMPAVEITLIRAFTYKRCCFCGADRQIVEYFYTDPEKDSIIPIPQAAPIKWYNLSVYPNPTANRVNLTANTAIEEPVQLQILDASGKLVLQQQLDFRNQADYTFDLSAYRHGSYFFRMQYMGETHVEKVLKLR